MYDETKYILIIVLFILFIFLILSLTDAFNQWIPQTFPFEKVKGIKQMLQSTCFFLNFSSQQMKVILFISDR